MTVVDRHAPNGAGVSVATDLRALLESARDDARTLVATTSPVDGVDPIALFAAARAFGFEAALWVQPAAGRSIVGVGRAWAVEPDGVDRFTAAADAWRAALADAVVSGAGAAGPTLLGGLGFTGVTPGAEDPWAPFGPASLVLPTFCVSTDGSATALTVALAADRLEDPDPLEVELAWEALTRGAAARQPVSPAQAGLRIVEERPDRAAWERTVGLFAGAVGRGRIDKVVLARRLVVGAAADLEVVEALRHLVRTAPESTTFAFSRNGTTFLGATPERLVRTSGRAFETVAIAGSAGRGRDMDEDARLAAALLASEKEREEHAVVVDMLRTSLTPIVETLDVADTPAILPLPHLQHLATTVTGTLREGAGLLALAGRLHPTPAVGGTPRDVALALIEEHEAFDRGWYAGPIGWLGADGDGEMMVALRCGLVNGPIATLFAGCGIVADSDPAREWEESRLKLRTMLAALGGLRDADR